MNFIIGIIIVMSSSLAVGQAKIRLRGEPYDLAKRLARVPVTTSVDAFTYLLTKEIHTMRFMTMAQLGGKFGIDQESAQRLIDYHNTIDLSVMTGMEGNIAELKSSLLRDRDAYMSKGVQALKRTAMNLNIKPNDKKLNKSQLWVGAAADTLTKLETMTHLSIFLEHLEQLIDTHSLKEITSTEEGERRALRIDKIVSDHGYLLPPDTVQEARKISEQVHEILQRDTSTRAANEQVFNSINDLLSTSLALLYRAGKYKVEANLIAELEPKGNLFIDPKTVLETAAMLNSSYDQEMAIPLDKFRQLYSALEHSMLDGRLSMLSVTKKLGTDVNVNLVKRLFNIYKLDQQFNEIVNDWGTKTHRGQVVDEYTKLLDDYNFLFDTRRMQQIRASLDAVFVTINDSVRAARALYAAAAWNDHDAIKDMDIEHLSILDDAVFLAVNKFKEELASEEMTLDIIKFMKKLNPARVQKELDYYLWEATLPRGVEGHDNNKKIIEILTKLGANKNHQLLFTSKRESSYTLLLSLKLLNFSD